MIDFLDLLPKDFVLKYKKRKPFVIRCKNQTHKNFITNLLNWKQISDYFHDNRRLTNLQIFDGKNKIRNWDTKLYINRDLPTYVNSSQTRIETATFYVSKKILASYWEKNCTIILPRSSLINEDINNLCKTYERDFSPQLIDTNIYISREKNSSTFPAHIDLSENFLFHIAGSVEWKVYKKFQTNSASLSEEQEKEHELEFHKVLHPGDILYLPKNVFHKSITKEPRITISFPVIGKGIPLERDYIDFDPGVFDVSKAR